MATPFPQKTLISQTFWLSLPKETRGKLAQLFDIVPSGFTQVENRGGIGRVVSDGYTDKDLGAIALLKLQQMLGSADTDFYGLLSHVVNSVDRFLEIKASGAVDEDWQYKDTTVVPKGWTINEEELHVSEDLKVGDLVRVRNGEVYKIGRKRGVRKTDAKTKAGK